MRGVHLPRGFERLMSTEAESRVLLMKAIHATEIVQLSYMLRGVARRTAYWRTECRDARINLRLTHVLLQRRERDVELWKLRSERAEKELVAQLDLTDDIVAGYDELVRALRQRLNEAHLELHSLRSGMRTEWGLSDGGDEPGVLYESEADARAEGARPCYQGLYRRQVSDWVEVES